MGKWVVCTTAHEVYEFNSKAEAESFKEWTPDAFFMYEKMRNKLTKEQMFDFILDNYVSLSIDTSKWSTVTGEQIEKKYTVAINGVGMAGFDLEEAIQYYHDNLKEDKES